MPRPDSPAPAPVRGGSRGPVLIPAEVLAARTPFAREMTLHRLGLRMSQMDLANATGVPQTSISAYEIGVVRPGPTSRAKIERVLGALPPLEDRPTREVPLTPAQLDQAKRQLGIE